MNSLEVNREGLFTAIISISLSSASFIIASSISAPIIIKILLFVGGFGMAVVMFYEKAQREKVVKQQKEYIKNAPLEISEDCRIFQL